MIHQRDCPKALWGSPFTIHFHMLQIANTLVSLEIIRQNFKCNIKKCMGVCCLHGDSGAPLTLDEKKTIKEVFPTIKPYLPARNQKILDTNGLYYKDQDGDWVTTLVKGMQCVFSYVDKDIYLCAFEKAFYDKKTRFQKPVSCHLYPIRVKEYNDFIKTNTFLN